VLGGEEGVDRVAPPAVAEVGHRRAFDRLERLPGGRRLGVEGGCDEE
jgi:hypothetical protein